MQILSLFTTDCVGRTSLWRPCLLALVLLSSHHVSQTQTRLYATEEETIAHSYQRIWQDDFQHGFDQWGPEAERPGRIKVRNGILEIDVPAGATLWFRHRLQGPIAIEYEAEAVSKGGENDRVSDLNCFWMATDPAAKDNDPVGRRQGAFSSYNSLDTYYVGLGGNGNTTTRFRRYIGDPGERPLLPENDRTDQGGLLVANTWQRILLIADGRHISYKRDGRTIFSFVDEAPYQAGWFALRTTKSHLLIRDFKIYQLRSER